MSCWLPQNYTQPLQGSGVGGSLNLNFTDLHYSIPLVSSKGLSEHYHKYLGQYRSQILGMMKTGFEA